MKIRIGSRGSKLAVTQAEWVANQLKKVNPSLEISFTSITTTGDKSSGSPIQEMGGKGVFVKEIEEALLDDQIDLAVHSLKDMPQMLSSGLTLSAFPEREDPRDVFISRFGELLHELPRGSIIGTSSPRRQAQIFNKYQKRNYRVESIRGNVETRIKKLKEGTYDGLVLALAGLKRLSLESEVTQILEPAEMLPAPCQGCLGIEMRVADIEKFDWVNTIKHPTSDVTARAERAFLQALDGNCSVPLGVFSVLQKDILEMEALLLDLKGERTSRVKEEGPLDQAELVGAKLAGRLLYEGGSEILATMST